MKWTRKHIAPIFFCLVSITVATAFHGTDTPLTQNRPGGWPAPAYQFSNNPPTRRGFELGKKLFYDSGLSRNHSVSCASCHKQADGFANAGTSLSVGANGLQGNRKSPSLCNLAWNKAFLWDGGVNNLEVQPLAPITNPLEMNNTLANVVRYLDSSDQYTQLFKNVFGDSRITGQRVLKALAQFTGSLVSCNSKYDKYMRGKQGATFTKQELHGLALFRKNCESCHKEPLFTDYSYKNTGLIPDPKLNDKGRMHITGLTEDSLKFKVPTLRNIAVAYPYMHDGRFKTLGEVIDHYLAVRTGDTTIATELRSGIRLSEEGKRDLISFLETLTDTAFLNNPAFHY